MEMRQVRYFLAVAVTRNFTRAAELCNVTQPALTRGVQKLEEELGGLLLRREHNLTHLTDFGRLITPHLEQLAANAEAAKSTAERFLKLENASISLGVMCTVGPARFMSFLAEFRKSQPGCELTIIEGVPERLADLLVEGRLDVAIMAQPAAFSDRLDVLPIYKERFCVAFPTGHRLQEKNAVSISDVQGETYLRRINCEYRDYLAEQCRARGFSVEVGFQSEREDWIQSTRRRSPGSRPGLWSPPKSPARSRWSRSLAGASRRPWRASLAPSAGTNGRPKVLLLSGRADVGPKQKRCDPCTNQRGSSFRAYSHWRPVRNSRMHRHR